jgi:hypothetical protein
MLRQEVEPQSVDAKLLDFVGDIYDRTKAVPRFDLLIQHFEESTDPVAGSRMSEVVTFYQEGNGYIDGPKFRYELDRFKSNYTRETASNMLLEASQILSGGLRRGGSTLEGPD